MVRRQPRALQIAVLAIAGFVAMYLTAGLVGAALVANPRRREPAQGVTIWVESNGIHTDLVMPKRAAGVDWRSVFEADAIGDPRFAGHEFVAIGWGERRFFLDTPTWWDVRAQTVVAAALGSNETVLHVEHVARPVEGERVQRVVLREAEYRRLAEFVRASLAEERPVRGYGNYDAFYSARGRYDALRTCNTWTGAALRVAGVRVGRWTPFPATVSWWL